MLCHSPVHVNNGMINDEDLIVLTGKISLPHLYWVYLLNHNFFNLVIVLKITALSADAASPFFDLLKSMSLFKPGQPTRRKLEIVGYIQQLWKVFGFLHQYHIS